MIGIFFSSPLSEWEASQPLGRSALAIPAPDQPFLVCLRRAIATWSRKWWLSLGLRFSSISGTPITPPNKCTGPSIHFPCGEFGFRISPTSKCFTISRMHIVHSLGAADRALLLNSVGRAANWIFQESQRPGQQTAMVATEALRESFSFPADDLRQGHLGFLLAYLAARGTRDSRFAAAEAAESQSISTSLDPGLERVQLEPLVTSWNEADRAGEERGKTRAARLIVPILRAEIERRLNLLEDCLGGIRRDRRRVNSGVAELESRVAQNTGTGTCESSVKSLPVANGASFHRLKPIGRRLRLRRAFSCTKSRPSNITRR